jgi:hypothetical protein
MGPWAKLLDRADLRCRSPVDQVGTAALEVVQHHVDAAALGPNPCLAERVQHAVMQQALAQRDDLDIGIFQPPGLTLGQPWGGCGQFHLLTHTN